MKRRTKKGKKMPTTKSGKCVANVEEEKCFYKKDLNYLSTQFAANDTAHKEIRESLKNITRIRLNGGDEETPIDIVLKDIWQATRALRKTNKLREAFADWRDNTKLGRILKTTLGKLVGGIILIWIILSSIHSLGVERVNPIKLIVALIELFYHLKG